MNIVYIVCSEFAEVTSEVLTFSRSALLMPLQNESQAADNWMVFQYGDRGAAPRSVASIN